MVGTTPTVMTPQLPNEDAVAIATDFFHCQSFQSLGFRLLQQCADIDAACQPSTMYRTKSSTF